MMKTVLTWCNFAGGETCKRKPDLIAIIAGGAEVIRGNNENITMNASLSYDPDVGPGNHSGMSFTWRYGEIKGNYSVQQSSAKEPLTRINDSEIDYFEGELSGPVITLDTALVFVSKTNVVKLVVTKDYRNSSVYQVIRLVNGNPPILSQR